MASHSATSGSSAVGGIKLLLRHVEYRDETMRQTNVSGGSGRMASLRSTPPSEMCTTSLRHQCTPCAENAPLQTKRFVITDIYAGAEVAQELRGNSVLKESLKDG